MHASPADFILYQTADIINIRASYKKLEIWMTTLMPFIPAGNEPGAVLAEM